MSKIYKILFWWYYSRVPEHFHQWPFRKSVKLLIQNYESHKQLSEGQAKGLSECIKENNRLRHEIANMKVQQIANPKTIGQVNKMFGAGFTNPDEN